MSDLDLSVFEDNNSNSNIKSLAEWCAVEDALLAELKKELTSRKDKLDEAKEQVAKMLQAKGLKSIKTDHGLNPGRTISTKYYRASGVEAEKICQWFEANGLSEHVRRDVNFQTMNSVLTERAEQGLSIPPADLLTREERQTLRLGGKSKFLSTQPIKCETTRASLQGGKVVIQ